MSTISVTGQFKIWSEQLRVLSWTKNLIIFIPILIYGPVQDINVIANILLSFFAFCLLASSVYLINDLKDKRADAGHKAKFRRPFLQGLVSSRQILTTSTLLMTISLLIFLYLGPQLLSLAVTYFFINALYTFKLKPLLGVNILLLALFHLIRFQVGIKAGLFAPPLADLILIYFLFVPLAISSHQENLMQGWSKKACLRIYKFFTTLFLLGFSLYVIYLPVQQNFLSPRFLLLMLPIFALMFVRFWRVSQKSPEFAYRLVPIILDWNLWAGALSLVVITLFAKTSL